MTKFKGSPPGVPAELAAKVADFSGGPEGPFFIYMKTGHTLDHLSGVHCFGEDTLDEVIETLAGAGPCNCEDCKEHRLGRGPKLWGPGEPD